MNKFFKHGRAGIYLLGAGLFLLSLVVVPSLFAQSRSGDNFTVTPVAAEEVPTHGTFWSLQRTNMPPWPLYPPFLRELEVPVYLLDAGRGVLLVDDSQIDYEAIYQQRAAEQVLRKLEYEAGLMSAQEYWALEGGEPQAARGDYPADALWLEITGLSNQLIYVTVHGTLEGETYEILSRESLVEGEWAGELPLVLGAAGQDWTAATVAVGPRTNLFLWVRSWVDDDGDGLPTWWEMEHGLDPNNPDTGDTGVPDGYKDGDHDGWTNMQEYQNGTNPNQFNTPAAPAGLVVQTDATGTHAKLTWLAANGPVIGYTIQRGSDNSLISVGNASVSHVDAATSLPTGWYYNYQLPSYRIRTEYAGGSSAWTDWQNVAELHSPVAQVISGADNGGRIVVAEIPAAAAFVRVGNVESSVGSPGYYLTNTVDIPVSQFTNGMAVLPATYAQAPAGSLGWAAQVVLTNAATGAIRDGWYDAYTLIPFWDGRAQLKDNLRFQLRIPGMYQNFIYWYFSMIWGYQPSIAPAEYAYASYYDLLEAYDGSVHQYLEPTLPFEENYRWRNFVFGLTNINPYGRIATGINWDGTGNQIRLTNPPAFAFMPPAIPAALPSLLTTNETEWLVWADGWPPSSYGFLLNGNEDFGINSTEIEPGSFLLSMTGTARSWFGLPYESYLMAWSNSAASTVILSPGNNVLFTGTAGYFYPGPAQPLFGAAAYYFTRVHNYWQEVTPPLPGYPYFTPTNTTPELFITSVGAMDFKLAGYAKLAVLNGYAGVYGYLQQYFDKAYLTTNGVVTTNATGILSPCGEFFPTEPGRIALVTMPDLDTNERGTATVYAVSMNLDTSGDGVMDRTFFGPDQTSVNRPFRFWANNDYDRFTLDKDDNRFYDDSVEKGDCPFTLNKITPDCNYRDGAGNRVIPSTRDLQDFTRLWVSGIDTNLLAALPPNSTITLSWGDVGSPNYGNPTIDLFKAADADGGIGYLTNATTALVQTLSLSYPHTGRLGPGQSLQLNSSQFTNGWAGNYFIWCGVSNGSGALTLTISQGGTNTLAQTTTYIQIQDIKQMYERWTIGDNPSVAPKTNAIAAVEDAGSFQYGAADGTNTPYILFVHGWNMKRWEKDRFAEAAFKRLYWQGYQGRFGSFRWPTDNGFTGSLWDVLTDSHNYDNSENIAWRSATGLLNKLNDLNAKYPGHVYLLAHSMGNVVAGEALRLAGSNQIVNTYIASQAAVPAHVYDSTSTNLIDFTHKHPSYPFNPANFGPTTPNIYGNWFAGNSAAAGRRINFYNANDFALSPDAWCFNQELKPDDFLSGFYTYFGSTNDPAPWNHFAFVPTFGSVLSLDIVNQIRDRYEAMAYAAESRSKAFGATADVSGLSGSLNLMTIWPTDTSGHNYADHLWHSAQFRGDTTQQWGYWRSLLRSPTVGFNISD